MSQKGPKNMPTSDRPVVLRPTSGNCDASYLNHKTAINKKISAHKRRSG